MQSTRDSWSRERRVVGKAGPRFLAASLAAREYGARSLYEDFCRQRGEMENRIDGAASASTARMYPKPIRGGDLPPDGRLPPVLPAAIYNGERRRSSAAEMLAAIAPVGGGSAPFQPRRRYLPIDEHRLSVEDLPEENVVSAQIALEQGSVPAMAAVLRRVSALPSGAEHASLRRAFAESTPGMVERSAAARTHPELASTLRAAAETGGLSAMGSAPARRIDEYIETTAEVGDLPIDCAGGAELLARA